MNNTFIKKSVCMVLTAAIVCSFAGCSIFAERKAVSVLTEALDAFYADPVNGLADYDEEYVVPEMNEKALELALEGLASSSYEIGEVKLNSDRTTAKIPVTFNDVILLEDIPMGTEEEVTDAVADCDTDSVEITFVLKNKKGDWKIEDMSELSETFFDPYTSIVYIDENGMPTDYYEPFFDECVVETVWYDPLMATPLQGNSLRSAEALLAYVYFDRPVYFTFTANLKSGNTVVQTQEITVDGSTTAPIEFWGESYSGSYTVELLFDGGLVAQSETLSVS